MIVKGQKVNDRYEIIKSIGEGGMANVYLAKDVILDRLVAVKVLRGDLANDEKFVRRFQREALSASSLSHPNIVEMYDVGEDDGDYYIVMEYVQGKTLKQLLKKRGALTVSEVVDIMLQITDAMTLAHNNLIIHRDLKPQNVMIQDDGGIKITDFGIAMALNSTQLTQTNSVMGSVHYLPPEQASGKGSTLKSDVYSLGIMMYELLTGKLPYRGDNAVEIALKHIKESIPSVKDANKDIPQSLDNIIKRATAKNPKNRYASAKELHDDLYTSLSKDRLNEPVVRLKYQETSLDETKEIKLEGDIDNSLVDGIVDKSSKKNKKIFMIFGAIFGVLALGFVSIFLLLPLFSSKEDVTVPDVSTLSVEEAEKVLKAKGFEVALDILQTPSEEIEEGLVVKTQPASGRSVKEGTVITIYVSSGLETYVVEDFTGKNYIEVKTILENVHGLKVTVEKRDVEDTEEVEDQEIIGQSIDPGTALEKGDSIIIYIPNIIVTYPDMVLESWTKDKVEEFAKKHELKVTYEYEERIDVAAGIVISQSRDAKTPVVKGSTFRVTISKEVEDPVGNVPDEEESENTENQEDNTNTDNGEQTTE